MIKEQAKISRFRLILRPKWINDKQKQKKEKHITNLFSFAF